MSEPSPYQDYKPITWFGRVPVYTAGILSALMVVGMFATVFLMAARVDLMFFTFIPSLFWHGSVWQILSYWMLQEPSFFFVIGIIFFAWFGTDVERYIGRSRFLQLFAIVLLAPALVGTAWWLCGANNSTYGSMLLSIGFFVAFATLYPNLEFFWGWITAKWLAFAGIVLEAMSFVARRDWVGFSQVLVVCAASFGYIRFLQLGAELPPVFDVFRKLFRRKPKFKVVPREISPRDEVHESIDPLLDKISKHGLSSLTAREKAQLQRARESLLKKEE